MSLNFEDRVPKYPNRYLLSVEGGTSYYVTLQRADEPTTVGTPLNAATLNQLATIAEMENLPNAHLWKKFSAKPGLVETEESGVDNTCITRDGSAVKYADDINIEDDVISLVNPITATDLTVNGLEIILGKYIYAEYSNSYYYIPPSAGIGRRTPTLGSPYIYATPRVKLTISGTKLGFVISDSKDTYPVSGEHTDGYWYEYYKQFGDCVGNATGGGVTMSQVNNAIDSAIGDAIGGSY